VKISTYFALVSAATVLLFAILWYHRKFEGRVEDAVIRRTAPEVSGLLDNIGSSVDKLGRTNPRQVRNAGISIIVVRVLLRLGISFVAANLVVGGVTAVLKPKGLGNNTA